MNALLSCCYNSESESESESEREREEDRSAVSQVRVVGGGGEERE